MEIRKKRILWLDVLKFIGILEIYMGHFGADAGNIYSFVFTHHVALFFFVSGCLENYNKDNLLNSIKKRAKNILIPYTFFAIISIICSILCNHKSGIDIPQMVKTAALGSVRNHFVAPGLWFLTALFMVSVIFQVFKKVKFKAIMIAISIIIYVLTQTVMEPNPASNPSLPYNLDSALYFLIYYVIGYCSISLIQKLFESQKHAYKILHYVLFAISAGYSILLYFGKCAIQLMGLYSIPFVCYFADILRSCIVIFFFVCVAYELRNVKLFADLGQETLYFCGNEYIVRRVVPLLLSAIGLKLVAATPMSVIIISFLLILVGHRLLVPWQKKIVSKVSNIKLKTTDDISQN